MNHINSLECNSDQLQCYSSSLDSPSSPLRRTTNYQHSNWDDSQIQSLTATNFTEGHMHAQQREKLKEDVRSLINREKITPGDQLKLIDSLRQLGVAYHFEEEIKHALTNLMDSSVEKLGMEFTDDVYVMSLFFRLLREHGFEISRDLLLKSCKVDNGCFKPSLRNDIREMLSLYEASFLAMEGEDELDEVNEFAIKHLSELMSTCSSTNPTIAKRIARALEHPLHKSIPRLQAWMFMEAKDNREEIMNPRLLDLAKLDFNMTQSIYMRELKEMMRWWTDLSISSGKLKFARDWLVESYFLAAGLAFEPQFQRCRKEFTKAISLIFVVDDIYDIYCSLEELQLFTRAIERWEVSAIKELPEYMRICLSVLMSTINELAQTIMEKGLDILPHLKRGWLDLCEAYMVEARWYHTRHIPKFEEYIEIAWITVATPLISLIAHCLNDNLSNASLQSFEFYPSIIRHSSVICRLYNDLGTSKGKLTRGDVAKSIQCYMNEKHVSETVAFEHIKNVTKKCWKSLNEEWLMASKYEELFKKVTMNLPRVAHLMYLQGNGGNGILNLQKFNERVISLLLEPIELKEMDA